MAAILIGNDDIRDHAVSPQLPRQARGTTTSDAIVAAVQPIVLATDGLRMKRKISHEEDSRIVLMGFPLYRILPSQQAQFLCLALLLVFVSIGFAALQERVLYVPGFKYTGWMALATSLTYTACALVEKACTGEVGRVGSLFEYTKLSVLTMGGMYFTNWSLRYLSYPLRVVFKSSKLIPVMLLSAVYTRKQYTFVQWLCVALLTLGLILFTLGDAKGKASFDPRGIVLIATGTVAEAFAATFEEKRLFGQLRCSPTEVILYSNIIGCSWALVADIVSGDLLPAVRHSADHPEVISFITLAAVMGYASQSVVLVLIKHFGATVAELVKSCRKILTICVSFVVYGKAWTLLHVGGGLLFAASIGLERFAVGGHSRRFAGLLFAASMSVTCWLLSGDGPSRFCVVIDAGSMSTRLLVFRFDAWTSTLLPIGNDAQLFAEGEPLHSFANNIKGISLMLLPLMSSAIGVVPPAQREGTPLAVRATSGLRLVKGIEAESMINETRRIIGPFGFKDGGVDILDGRDEGEYFWLAVNFLLGAFRPGMQSVKDPCAVIDLGAGAVQMAYWVNDADAEEAGRTALKDHIRDIALPFLRGNAKLYQQSYLGYGLMRARVKVLAGDADGRLIANQKVNTSAHPCFASGAAVAFRDKYTDRKYHAHGASDASVCRSLASRILNKEESCSKASTLSGNCSFAGRWGGPGHAKQRLLIASYFYERMADAGVISQGSVHAELTAGDYAEQAQRICDVGKEGADAVLAMLPHLTWDRAAWLCFDLSYQASLLLEGFGVARNRSIIVATAMADTSSSQESAAVSSSFFPQIESARTGLGLLPQTRSRTFHLSWALGVAVRQISNAL